MSFFLQIIVEPHRTMSSIFRKKKSPTSVDDDSYDCIVIGAGWSGIAAARTLLEKGGISNIVVLEARDYVGGRCRSAPTVVGDDNVKVEHGCQWINECNDENPIFEVAQEMGVKVIPPSRTEGVWTSEGKRLSHFAKERIWWRYQYAIVPYIYATQFFTRRADKSLRQVLDSFNNLHPFSSNESKKRMQDLFSFEVNLCVDYAADIEDMSLWMHGTDEGYGVGENSLLKNANYTSLMEHYARPIKDKIRLQTKVICIDSTNCKSDGVTVVCQGANQKQKQYRAKTVIISVPLGVLKEGHIEFKPPLPRVKQDAIDRIGMGLLNKTIMVWDDEDEDKLPWPKDIEWMNRLTTNGKFPKCQTHWTSFHNGRKFGKHNILVAFSSGSNALRLEKLSDFQIKEEALAALHSMFGTVPEPKEVIITRWQADEFACGSYSFNKVNQDEDDRENLKKPLQDCLFWAGEATSDTMFGTCHGAFLSGIDAGNSAINEIKKQNKKRLGNSK